MNIFYMKSKLNFIRDFNYRKAGPILLKKKGRKLNLPFLMYNEIGFINIFKKVFEILKYNIKTSNSLYIQLFR